MDLNTNSKVYSSYTTHEIIIIKNYIAPVRKKNLTLSDIAARHLVYSTAAFSKLAFLKNWSPPSFNFS
jgi:hypothetical protein